MSIDFGYDPHFANHLEGYFAPAFGHTRKLIQLKLEFLASQAVHVFINELLWSQVSERTVRSELVVVTCPSHRDPAHV
jgi:hypothetical protein